MAKVRTRKRGKTWSFIFEAGKKEDGKRRVVEKGGFLTKEAAYDAGTAAYTDWKHGNIGITSENITVADFLQNWLDNVAAMNVRTTTFEHYASCIKNSIVPYFPGVTVQSLTPAMLDKWMRTLAQKGLARKTLQNIYALFHHALDYAVYPSELIASNPIVYIKVPRSAPAEVVKRTIVTPEQFAELLEKHPFGTPLHIPLLLLYHTGMRRGEVLGLSWNDIDLKRKTITLVRQVVYYHGEKGWHLTDPKTQSSRRKFVIDEFLAEELRKWKAAQKRAEREQGDAYVCIYQDGTGKMAQASKRLPPEDGWLRFPLVCTRSNGKLVTPNYLGEHLQAEGLNPHSFRHTHATQLIENGATPKGVAGRLGHRNAVITQNLYTHNTDKLQEDTAAIFEKTMQTNTKSRQNADKKNE